MVLLEDLTPQGMRNLERKVQSDLRFGAKMEAELQSIARRDAISGVLSRLTDGSDSDMDEILAEEAMEMMEQEDLEAEERWIQEMQEKQRRMKVERTQMAMLQEQKRVQESIEQRRRAMAVEVARNPPWLEGPTDSRRHFSGKTPPHMAESVDRRAAEKEAANAANAKATAAVMSAAAPSMRSRRVC